MNGVNLHFLTTEINSLLTGARIKRITQIERLIYIDINIGQLVVSLLPEAMGLYFQEKGISTSGYKSRSKYLEGRIIGSIEQDGLKPVMVIKIRGQAGFYGTISFVRNYQNLTIHNIDGKSEAFFMAGNPPVKKKLNPEEVDEEHLSSLLNSDDRVRAIVDSVEGIDRYLAREIVEEPGRFTALVEKLKKKTSEVNIISIKPLRLSIFQNGLAQFDSFNKAFKFGIESYLNKIKEDERRKRIETKLKKLNEIKSQLEVELFDARKADEFRIKGQAILSNLKNIEPRLEKIILPNPYDAAEKIEITLDPKIAPEDNAQNYFARYKKLKRKIPFLENRLVRIEKDINKLRKGILEEEKVISVKIKDKEEIPEHFRRFVTRGGFEVFVGKDAKTNDELTFKFARSFDIFFHTRGIPGSHTLLRTAKKKPSKYDIYDAAAIAAYFSKARNAKKVPVSYTERKYLKKNKKGPPGSVILVREEVIFVDPCIPQSNANI